jgi:hypothetical protein
MKVNYFAIFVAAILRVSANFTMVSGFNAVPFFIRLSNNIVPVIAPAKTSAIFRTSTFVRFHILDIHQTDDNERDRNWNC